MSLYHNTRDLKCRQPFGAVTTNTKVKLSLFAFEHDEIACYCRLWHDDQVTLLAMKANKTKDGQVFTCEIFADHPSIIWYYFIIEYPNQTKQYYGAQPHCVNGLGQTFNQEPGSFQFTVYQNKELPKWYKNAVVYQIFPDSFKRGDDFSQRVSTLKEKRNGISKTLRDNWLEPINYKKNEKNEVISWDFYGGTLDGIRSKLSYLSDLGITAIYLNPIFMAASTHRYDTADYLKIDPLLGDVDSLKHLISEAKTLNIYIILDGVFSHTGSDSIYFNKYGNFDSIGAYQSESSPYRNWYIFSDTKIGYDCWWNVADLPNVNENIQSYRDFVYNDKESVINTWSSLGIKGWRLDVADELPDDFIKQLKAKLIEIDDQNVLIGEVWEDATNKISYGTLRKYLIDDSLDAVMNYPMRDSLLNYLINNTSAHDFSEVLYALMENYPKDAFYACLNILGTHDRSRVLTVLGSNNLSADIQKQNLKLDNAQKDLAKKRLWLALIIQMLMPGVPSVYYGDEAGMEGLMDPFNRGPYNWDEIDKDCFTMTRNAIALRKSNTLFVEGLFKPLAFNDDVFGFWRINDDEKALVLVNRNAFDIYELDLEKNDQAYELISATTLTLKADKMVVSLRPLTAYVIYYPKTERINKPLKRGLGVLCHITSLPNQHKKGCINDEAKAFVDKLNQADYRYWQILPLNPCDIHQSPYAGTSAFAGNIELLPMSKKELALKFKTFQSTTHYQRFLNENMYWLKPYALYQVLSRKFKDDDWRNWPSKYRDYTNDVINNEKLLLQSQFEYYCQYQFFNAWQELKSYTNSKDIYIIGDIPFYVAYKSADVWSNQEYFILNDDHSQKEAGVPPDYFSVDGQHWQNPLYNWQNIKNDDWHYWINRIKHSIRLYDYVRLDHFIGFESYYTIMKDQPAATGSYAYGPGYELFKRAYDLFGNLPLIAEDLGTITPAVLSLLAQTGFSGMAVYQFIHDEIDTVIPSLKNKIFYTGTHDNQTLVGWCKKRSFKQPKRKADLIISDLCSSDNKVIILPLQDVLLLDDKARMNTPATTKGNWQWQTTSDDIINRLLPQLLKYKNIFDKK